MKQEDLTKKVQALERELKELKNKQWRYKVGDTCLFKGYRRVTITELLDNNKYGFLYRGDIELGGTECYFKQDELQPYNMTDFEYIQKLLFKIFELEEIPQDLSKFKGMKNYKITDNL